jgi:hypothetical protein
MDLSETEETDPIAQPWADPEGTGRGRYPLENPGVEPITEELLILPHPGEPGVGPDGVAAPRENPWGYRRRGSTTVADRGE